MHRRLLTVTGVSGVLAATCLMASCGGTTAAPASTTANSTTGTGGAAVSTSSSKAPIVVGGDGDLLEPGVPEGFAAGIYRFNKAGGIGGRQIKFVGFLNDGFSAQTNLTNAQQLVLNDHVTAIVPFDSALASGATASFLSQNKVPFIGWNTSSAFLAAPTWGFGINGNQGNPNVQGLAGNQQLLAMTGNTSTPKKLKVAYIAENIAPGITANKALASSAKAAGIDVVYEGAPIAVAGTTSYAPYAQAIMASGANEAFETLDAPDAVGLAAALKAAGFRGIIVNGVTYVPGQLAGQPNEAAALNGVYVVDQFPADENHTPAVIQARKDLASTGQPPNLTSGVSVGYWSAIVFEQMLKATLVAVGGNPDNITGAALQKTVNSGFVYTDPIPGGIGTEYFPAAETIPTGCDTIVQTTGTTFKQIAPYQCSAINGATKKVVDQKTGQ
jgi:ABC-type branched-subunit amino acid transport system substrate-binding protein